MRKLAKVLLAGVAALSLTACGQAEGTTGSSADTTATVFGDVHLQDGRDAGLRGLSKEYV